MATSPLFRLADPHCKQPSVTLCRTPLSPGCAFQGRPACCSEPHVAPPTDPRPRCAVQCPPCKPQARRRTPRSCWPPNPLSRPGPPLPALCPGDRKAKVRPLRLSLMLRSPATPPRFAFTHDKPSAAAPLGATTSAVAAAPNLASFEFAAVRCACCRTNICKIGSRRNEGTATQTSASPSAVGATGAGNAVHAVRILPPPPLLREHEHGAVSGR